jgi:hypothetical protein
MSNDIAVGITGGPSVTGTISKKPSYLITLEDNSGKTKSLKRFITLDKPETLNGFLQAKGIFSELSEGEISKNFVDLLTSSSRELVLDMLFPWHRIFSVRSLVFKAK